MMTELGVQSAVILFFTGTLAGFVDSIAGGGGLIAMPVLFSIGLPPAVALGTNKFQASFGSFSAALNYVRKGVVRVDKCIRGICFTLIGAALGAFTIQLIAGDFLEKLVPVLLLVVFCYTLLTPQMGYQVSEPKMGSDGFYVVFGLGLGFYDGFFGPGTGSFWMAAFLIVFGMDMRQAAGHTKIMNFTSNIVSLIVFLIGGKVLFGAGLCMAAGQFLGARAGSALAIQKGAGIIRPVFLFIVFVTIVKLAWQTYLQ